MTLTLPDDPALTGFRAEELLMELACGLYAARHISRGAAARVAGVEEDAFEAELARRGISNGYTPDDLRADLAALDRVLGE